MPHRMEEHVPVATTNAGAPPHAASRIAATTVSNPSLPYASGNRSLGGGGGGVVEGIVAFQRAELAMYREGLDALQRSVGRLVVQHTSASRGSTGVDGAASGSTHHAAAEQASMLCALMQVVQDSAERQSGHMRALSERVRELEDLLFVREASRGLNAINAAVDGDTEAGSDGADGPAATLPQWRAQPPTTGGAPAATTDGDVAVTEHAASLSERRSLQETLPPLLNFFDEGGASPSSSVGRLQPSRGTTRPQTGHGAMTPHHDDGGDRNVSITSMAQEVQAHSPAAAARAVRFATNAATQGRDDAMHVVASPSGGDGLSLPPSPAVVSAQKYTALKAKYFLQKRRAQEAVAARVAAAAAWRRLWLQSAVLRGTWRCVVRMSAEGTVAAWSPPRSAPSPPSMAPSAARYDAERGGESTLCVSDDGRPTIVTCGAEAGPRKARVDGYLPGSVGCWDAASRVVEEQMAVCRCGGNSVVVVVGGPSTGRASLSHDVAVQALSKLAQHVDNHGAVLPPSSALRVTCTLCDADDVWSIPVRPIHRDDLRALTHCGSIEAASNNTISMLFHERRAKFSGCHMLISVDVVAEDDAIDDVDGGGGPMSARVAPEGHRVHRLRVVSRFTVVDVVPPSPNERGDGGDAVSTDLQHAMLAMATTARGAFLQRWGASRDCNAKPSQHHKPGQDNVGSGRPATPPNAHDGCVYESSHPLCSLLHQLQGAEDAAMTSTMLVASVGPHAADGSTWATVRFAAKMRQASMCRAAGGTQYHHHTAVWGGSAAGQTSPSVSIGRTASPPANTTSVTPAAVQRVRTVHAFDQDVVGRLEFDHEL